MEFLDGSFGVADKARAATGPKIDYKEVLNEVDFAVFARLRDLRKVISDKEAIPAYSIFTNEQLAAMVTGQGGFSHGDECHSRRGSGKIG